ncbi:MAG: prenyltransferase/squalene oxidase repeat-containing protein [Planctomycetia bacterium]|nr:prenyltransferase/squalene oxidase repeat-containing protein [Planctomycetia bacterium]
MDRRNFLKTAVFTVTGKTVAGNVVTGNTILGNTVSGTETSRTGMARGLRTYLESLAKPDGGYGWPEQEDSYPEVIFAVVGVYHLLRELPPQPEAVAEAILRNPYSGKFQQTRPHASSPYHLAYQQMQTLTWLGKSTDAPWSGIRNKKKVTESSAFLKAYELGGNPVMAEESVPILCREIRKESCEELRESYVPYFQTRQRKNGTYNTTLATDGSDGHVVNTYYGLLAEKTFGMVRNAEVVSWLQACQRENGGFTWSPEPELGNVQDLYYMWHAVKALRLVGAQPKNVLMARDWVKRLRNPDGGFSDRVGGKSSPLATFWAVDLFPELIQETQEPEKLEKSKKLEKPEIHVLSTVACGENKSENKTENERENNPETSENLAGLRAWTVQLEAPGCGSVLEAVELARTLKIHLWGAKNSNPEWIFVAQKKADELGVPVTFFASNEEYGFVVDVPGIGRFTHLNDPISPKRSISPWSRRQGTWKQFWEEKLAPMKMDGERMIWQICDHEVAGRLLLDESLLHDGYAMLSTFHFGCHNMAWATPYIMRYRHEIPMVALQDAHGEAWWWRNHLTRYKTLFLAEKPTWAGWLNALEKKRVVAVRKDRWTFDRLRMLGGSDAVRKRFMELRGDWEITENPEAVSLCVLSPEDTLEPCRPTEGRVLRIRVNREWIEGKMLDFASTPVTLECVRFNGVEKPFSCELRHVEDGWLKGRVEEESFYAPIPETCREVEAVFRVEDRTFTRKIEI